MTVRVRPWIPALLWGACIFVVSSQPRLPVPLETGTDKIAHCLTYTVLGALLARGKAGSGMPTWLAAAVGMLYAASDEWHQSFVPGRSADAADWVADAVGVILGLILYHWGRRRVGRSNAPPARLLSDQSSS